MKRTPAPTPILTLSMLRQPLAGWLLIGITLAPSIASAEPDAENEVWKGVFSSFSTPLGKLVDGSAEESLSYRLAFDLPADNSTLSLGGGPAKSSTVQFGLKYVPLTSWFLNVNLLKYLQPDIQKPWNPDFTYSFGYDDWRPYTFSAQYSNNGGNRFQPDIAKKERRTDFMSGGLNVSFKFPMPKFIHPLLALDEEDAVGCSVGMNLSPHFTDLATNSVQNNKKTMTLGCKYALPSNWYFNFSLAKFVSKEQQQPWDGDYTYGFGYFDWHPGSWSFQYNNYSGNRFPWHTKVPGTGRFKDGSFTLSTSGNWL
jgi:hypothetical protein